MHCGGHEERYPATGVHFDAAAQRHGGLADGELPVSLLHPCDGGIHGQGAADVLGGENADLHLGCWLLSGCRLWSAAAG